MDLTRYDSQLPAAALEINETGVSPGQYVLEDVGNSLIFGVERSGGGQIVYFVDNVLFRNFWYNGKLMVANALFFVGQ